MAEEKVTEMLLKVDLDCYSCYKKIKKTLCKFPQIRDQIYDEKNNTVKITVVCCSPEKIRDKLCCRGGSSIKSIEILEPSKPKPKEPEKKKEAEKPKPQQKEPDQKPKQLPEKPKESEKPKDNGKPKASEKPKEVEKPKDADKPKPKPKEAEKPQPPPQAAVPMPVQPPKQPEPVHNVPVPVMMATQACPMELYSSCGQCYGGGGPCCHGYGMPVAPPQCYDNRGNIYGYPYGNGGGYYGYNNNNQRCHLDRCCDYYLSEENPSSCAIM